MRILALITIFFWAMPCYGQDAPAGASTSSPKPFADTIVSLKNVRKEIREGRIKESAAKGSFVRAIGSNPIELIRYLAGTEIVRSFLSEAEQKRIDKQIGSGANTSGTTSLVSKGSVPALFGLAVENGAITQDVNGTTITFRANPAGFIKALVKQDYLTSGPTNILTNRPESDFWYIALNKASVAISFDTSKGQSPGTFTAERSQLASYSAHIDIINHRDPRDKKNTAVWEQLRKEGGETLAKELTDFAEKLIALNGYGQWESETASELLKASSDDEIESTFLERAGKLPTLLNKDREFIEFMKSRVIPAVNAYAEARVGLLNKINKSLSAAFDYTNTRQVVTLGATEIGTITLPPGVTNALPNLGNFLLTISGRFIGESEITANISGTRFNGRRVGPNIGRWRDARAGLQIDVPLPKIRMDWEKPTLTFSYLYLNLLEEPLGEKILVNGVEQSRKGPINFGQVKLEIPIGSSGLRIPISMTFSNRTELIKERQVRGHIGVTFDFDKIFSRPQ
jgi:hypothetical protein